MIYSMLSLLPILALLFSCSFGYKNEPVFPNNSAMARNKLVIKIGTNTFYAALHDNATTAAFKNLPPLTVTMKELNGNEKYADLSKSLVTNASNPQTIQSGDLMLYGSNTLVLIYKYITNSYSYTKIRHLNDTAGLAAAVGSGKVTVTVTFELE